MVGDAYDTLRQQLASVEAQRDRAVKDAERVREWVCHNGGLLNEWAAEWKPGRETCTAYIRRRLDAAITEEKQK